MQRVRFVGQLPTFRSDPIVLVVVEILPQAEKAGVTVLSAQLFPGAVRPASP